VAKKGNNKIAELRTYFYPKPGQFSYPLPNMILPLVSFDKLCIGFSLLPVAGLERGVRGVRPPKIRKAYVIQR
jgi:hypothetical protein